MPRRAVVRFGLLAFVLVLGWVGVRGLLARQRLEEARAEVPRLRAALLSAERGSVPGRIAEIQRDTRAARRLTSDPVWAGLSRLPWAGRSLRTAAGLAEAADDLATGTFPALDRAAAGLSPETLRGEDGRIDLAPLVAAAPDLAGARDSAVAAERRVRALPSSLLLGAVGRARTSLLAELGELRETMTGAAAAARVAPAMLGRDGVRRYFLAILNNAEMRGSGGFLGAYGILEADRGKLRLVRLGVAEDLRNTAPEPALDLGPEFVSRYRRFFSDSWWTNANLSPHFPDAAAIWTALWARTHGGERLDGVVAVDPVALAGLLAVTGPATLPDGELVGAANVVSLTESEAYERFAADGRARDVFLQQVAVAAYRKLESGSGDDRALLAALGRAAGRRHLQLASAHPDEQAALESTPIAGVMPSGEGPYLEVTTVNAGGNKLDYWVRRSIRYERRPDGTATVEVRLLNIAPPGLTPYVRGRLDLPPGTAHLPGQQHEYVSVYAGTGVVLDEALLDGRPITVESEVQRGHPVYSAYVDLDPFVERVLTLRLARVPAGLPLVRQPPLVAEDDLRIAS